MKTFSQVVVSRIVGILRTGLWSQGEDGGSCSDKCPGGVPWIPEVFSCMRRLISSDKDLTEQETTREKSLALRVGGWT